MFGEPKLSGLMYRATGEPVLVPWTVVVTLVVAPLTELKTAVPVTPKINNARYNELDAIMLGAPDNLAVVYF